METTWEYFSYETNGEHASIIKLLNILEAEGWEPRVVQHWGRISAGDPQGVTIYARKKS
jgi:hypothetical protein